jgi:hypothetical protein
MKRYGTMSEETSNRGACQGSISPTTRLGATRAVMAVMVALLMLIGAISVSAEQTPAKSVKRTIDNVIQILNTDALKQPTALWNDVRRLRTSSGSASAMKTWPDWPWVCPG